MKKKENNKNQIEFTSAFYTMYIYVALAINVIVSFVKYYNKHTYSFFENLKELTFDFNIIFIIFVLIVFLSGLYNFCKSTNKNVKELLLLILSIIISFIIVPYFINHILLLIIILGIIIYVSSIFAPQSTETKMKIAVINSENDRNNNYYIKGRYVYTKDGEFVGSVYELDNDFVNSIPKIK